jgi:hypothetical protein
MSWSTFVNALQTARLSKRRFHSAERAHLTIPVPDLLGDDFRRPFRPTLGIGEIVRVLCDLQATCPLIKDSFEDSIFAVHGIAQSRSDLPLSTIRAMQE